MALFAPCAPTRFSQSASRTEAPWCWPALDYIGSCSALPWSRMRHLPIGIWMHPRRSPHGVRQNEKQCMTNHKYTICFPIGLSNASCRAKFNNKISFLKNLRKEQSSNMYRLIITWFTPGFPHVLVGICTHWESSPGHKHGGLV